MKKIKAFFYVYVKSLTSPSYYKDVLRTNIGFSIKYYLVLVLFVSFITTVSNSISIIPDLNARLREFVEHARQAYPQDLVIEFKGGSWSINREEPFVIPMPKRPNEQIPENLVVFYKEGTVSDIELFDTVILVNNVNLIVRGANGIQARPLSNVPDSKIDRETFDGFVDAVFTLVKILPYLIFIFILFGLLVYYIFFRMFHVLLIGGIVYLLSLINKKPLDYIKSFKVALHTMTLPITFQFVLDIARVKLDLPLWFFIMNLFFATVVLFKLAEPSLKKKR